MKRIFYLLFVCFCGLVITISCSSNKVELWNSNDFSGWKLFVEDENINVSDVWSVKDGVIHCKGIPTGYMRTEDEYSDFTLFLDWRWVTEEGNSGVLLHAQAPDQIWPNCIECQLKSGSAGDFVLMGPGSIVVKGEKHTNTNRFYLIKKNQDGVEKPIGEWNTYKIICRENKISCYVNDVLQNEGTQASFSKGNICLQSEGAPIEFKNIYLEKLE